MAEKWEETILSEDKLKKLANIYDIPAPIMVRLKEIVGIQAKITWPIAEKVGIKKVVDWVEIEFTSTILGGEKRLDLSIMDNEWKAKLKEWGINPEEE